MATTTKSRPGATYAANIRRWMRKNKAEHVDPSTGELNHTALVEAWDRDQADGARTLDPDHIAWEIATEFSA